MLRETCRRALTLDCLLLPQLAGKVFASPAEAEARGLDFANLRAAIDASEAAWKEDGLECNDDDDDEDEDGEDVFGDDDEDDGEARPVAAAAAAYASSSEAWAPVPCSSHWILPCVSFPCMRHPGRGDGDGRSP